MVKKLFPTQEDALAEIVRNVHAGFKRILVQRATGGGKTVIFSALINWFLNNKQRKVVVLVHREELLHQAVTTLKEWYGITAFPITRTTTFLPNVMVYVAMVETANNRLRANVHYFGNIGLWVIDEVHEGEFNKMYAYAGSEIVVGFSATTIASEKNQPLKNFFQTIIVGPSIVDLIQSGDLVQTITYNLGTVDRRELRMKGSDYDVVSMGAVFSGNKHIQTALAAYKKYAEGKKTMIFNCNIAHSKKVLEVFKVFGYNCRHIDGTSPDKYRRETVEWFRHTPNAILMNCEVFVAGFDEPSMGCLITNFSTMSLRKKIQAEGRIARPFPGKKIGIILDLGGNSSMHGDFTKKIDWRDLFYNPEKAFTRQPDESYRVCPNCRAVILASSTQCTNCSTALRQKTMVKEGSLISVDDLFMKSPIRIDLPKLISDMASKRTKSGEAYKDISVLHSVRGQILVHVTKIWGLRKIEDQTADRLIGLFMNKVAEWCDLKGIERDKWIFGSAKSALLQDFKRAFGYEPKEKEQKETA